MLKVIAQDFIRPESIETVRPLYDELVRRTREESLCVSYELFADREDEGHFVFIETWPDRAALDTHCATAHFRTLVPQIDAHRRRDGIVFLMDEFGPVEPPRPGLDENRQH